MNILPKKRWHVRTKDNIARVRRDEAEAAEQEKERIRRAKLAEQEARTAFLRSKVRSNDTKEDDFKPAKSSGKDDSLPKKVEADIYTSDGNINFFKDLEQGKQTDGTNKEYEAEKKAEQEKYEKSIGYLTYLGQDSHEATGSKAWYELQSGSVAAYENSGKAAYEEVGLKSKAKLDPINDIIKYTGLKPLKKTVPGIRVDISLKGENGLEDNVKQSELKRKKDNYSEDNENIKRGMKHAKAHKKKKKKGKHSKKKCRDRDSVKHRKKCKDKNTEIIRNRKRKRSSNDTDVHDHKRHKKEHCSESSSSSESYTDSDDMSSTESIDEKQYQKEKQTKLEALRAERLKREAEERRRAERLLAGKKPGEVEEVTAAKPSFEQKYNSQYNPHLARQNQLQSGVKYWLQ